MTKSALAVALLALTGTALVAPSAAADPPPGTPTVNIATGQTLSEVEPLLVTDLDSTALSVRVTYAGQLLAPLPVVEEPPGVFTAAGGIDTWGLGGNNKTLTVAQCAVADGTDCGDEVSINTKVDNPNPTYDFSPAGTEFSEDFDLTAHLAAATGDPRLRLVRDGGTPTYVDPEEVTPVDTDALLEGPHSIAVDVCSTDESRCIAGVSAPFDVVRSVTGTFSVSAPAFSPNGDGQFDTLTFSYTQQDVWDSAAIQVVNALDQVVFSGPVPLPAPLNDGSFLFDGKDALGVVLPDGSYSASLSVSRTLDSGSTVSSTLAPRAFTVDNTALAPATLTSQWPTIYPYDDAYRISTKLTYTGLEQYSAVNFVVWNSADPPVAVRTKPILSPADAVWNGRNDAGSRVPAGTYTVVVRVIDMLGNIGTSPTVTVKVSAKKLVTVTKSVTVTPKASRVGGVTGACSTRRTPSFHKWAGSTGYLSNTRCRTTFKASIVWTHNRVHLASAVRYRWVRLGWYGGPTNAASHHRAIATLYDTDNKAVGWFSSVDYMAAQYIPSAKGSLVVEDGDVSWGFQTDRGNRYDVKSFTITYRADVLR